MLRQFQAPFPLVFNHIYKCMIKLLSHSPAASLPTIPLLHCLTASLPTAPQPQYLLSNVTPFLFRANALSPSHCSTASLSHSTIALQSYCLKDMPLMYLKSLSFFLKTVKVNLLFVKYAVLETRESNFFL